ncbi:MAG: N-acetyltransferase family protein [Kofleriaceae bacterium]
MIPGRRCGIADAPAIQAVLDTDPAMWELICGAPLLPNTAEEELAWVPPGSSLDRKYFYLVDDVAVLDVIEGYPDPATWFVGLIFIAPNGRNRGLGTQLFAALAGHVRDAGGRAIRLAVVSTHDDAKRFYDRLGFRFIERKPRTMPPGTAQLLDVLERVV